MRLTQWFCKFELCPQKIYQTLEEFENSTYKNLSDVHMT